MIVLGIDPGLATCGFALVEAERAGGHPRVRDLGVWVTSPRLKLTQRMAELQRDLSGFVREHEPNTLVIEAPTFPRSARASAMLFGAWGMAMGLCAGSALIVNRGAGEWRQLIGLGKRSAKGDRKEDTMRAMRRRFPGAAALLGESLPGGLHNHAYDALAIACSWVDVAGGLKTKTNTARRAA